MLKLMLSWILSTPMLKVMEKRCVKVMNFLKLNVWPLPAVIGRIIMTIVGLMWVRINVGNSGRYLARCRWINKTLLTKDVFKTCMGR